MKIEPQVEGKKEFLCRNLVKIRPTVWALEGSKVLKKTFTQLAAAVASADQSSSDQSSCHIQLIWVGAPYCYVENELGTNFFTHTGQLLPAGILFSAGNS